MNLYVTTSELKTYMGLSGTKHDLLLEMLNKQATSLINGILCVTDLALHGVTGEVHDAIGQVFYMADCHVVHVGKIMDDSTEYTQDEAYDIDNYVLRIDDYLVQGKRKATIDYAAGWNASGMAYIDIVDYSGLGTDTVTIGSTVYTEGTNWDAETNNNTTASNLATALDADSTVRAFAIGPRVYVIDEVVGQTGKISIAIGDSTNMTVSGSTLADLDFPEDIRGAVMILVSAMYQARKNPRLRSYTIGQKTVTMGSEAEFQMFKNLIKPYIRSQLLSV